MGKLDRTTWTSQIGIKEDGQKRYKAWGADSLANKSAHFRGKFDNHSSRFSLGSHDTGRIFDRSSDFSRKERRISILMTWTTGIWYCFWLVEANVKLIRVDQKDYPDRKALDNNDRNQVWLTRDLLKTVGEFHWYAAPLWHTRGILRYGRK